MLNRLIAVFALFCASPTLAGPVQLVNEAGQPVLEGTLLSREGELFRLETEHGPVTIDAGYLRCSGVGCPDPADLTARVAVGGTPDLVHRLLPALLEGFADHRGLVLGRTFIDDDRVSWELRETESDRLLAVFDAQAMADNKVASALLSDEIGLGLGYTEANVPVRQSVVALDALVPAVSSDNSRAMVTLDQLNGLLNGRMASWRVLGGPDVPVEVHMLDGWNLSSQKFGSIRNREGATRHTDPSDLADSVASDPGALGLLPYSSIGNAVPLVVSGACGLATPATRDTIRAEDYPATHPLFLQRVGARQHKIIRDFIAFSRSPDAQMAIRAAGFVDQAIGQIGFERQGDRIANAVLSAGEDRESVAEVRDMIGTLLNGSRLTLTFRFRDGSSDLDPQSVSNIQRLADAISEGAFDGNDVLFVGFSDGAGPAQANLQLSERRARSVRRAVAARSALGATELRVAAFGELMPMACDDTPWGGQVNRRVEVWITPSEVTR